MSNCKDNIGPSTIDNGSKVGSDGNSANNAWRYVLGSGAINYNNNKNNTFTVRPCTPVLLSATDPAVYDIPFSSVIQAWMDCERCKKNSPSCIKFRWKADRELVDLWQQMREARYKPRQSITFMVTYPVLREVWAGAFRDRIVHHWEALRFLPVIEKFLVESGDRSYNCRKGYGNIRAIADFEKMLYAYTDRYTRSDCWIVGGDFANYFMSIDKERLWEMLEQLIMDEYTGTNKAALLAMMRVTLFNNCRENFSRRSPVEMWDKLPPRKSLFHMNGLPIGNLTSQLWANFYGSLFVQWMVHVRNIPDCLIFVDDFRALVRSAEEGRQLLAEIRSWLMAELGIELHPNKVYLQHWTKGTKMVGAVVKPRRTYVSNRTRGAMIRKIKNLQPLAEKARTLKQDSKEMWEILDHVRASMNSYLGMMVNFNSYKVRRRIVMEHFLPDWGKWFYSADEFRYVKIRRKYDPRETLKRVAKDSKRARKLIRPIY